MDGEDLYSSVPPQQGDEEGLPSVDLYGSCAPVGHEKAARSSSPAKQPPKPKPRMRPGKLVKTETADESFYARSKSTDTPSVTTPIRPTIPVPNSAPPINHPNPWNCRELQRQPSLDLYTSMQPNIHEQTDQTNTNQLDPFPPCEDMYQGVEHQDNFKQIETQLHVEFEQKLRIKDDKIAQLEKQVTIYTRQSGEIRQEMKAREDKMRIRKQDMRIREQTLGIREQNLGIKEQAMVTREQDVGKKLREAQEKEVEAQRKWSEVEQREEWTRKREGRLKDDREDLERRSEAMRVEQSSVDEQTIKLRQQERSLRTNSRDLLMQKQELETRETEMTQRERQLGDKEKALHDRERKLQANETTLSERQRDFDKREQEVRQRHQPTTVFARSPTLPRVISAPVVPRAPRGIYTRRDEELARQLQEEEQASLLSRGQASGSPSAIDDATYARQLQQQLAIDEINEQHQRLQREQEETRRREEEQRKQKEENERQDRLLAEQLDHELNAAPPVDEDARIARQIADQEDVINLTRRSQPVSISEVRPATPATLSPTGTSPRPRSATAIPSPTGTSPRPRSATSASRSRYLSIEEIQRSLKNGQ